MRTKEELKAMANAAVDTYSSELIAIGRKLRDMPETGFKEYKSSALVKSELEKIGLEVENKIALTGLKAKKSGKNSFANIAICSELDALIAPNHKFADKNTGAAHACCHHAQSAVLIGVANALVKSGVINELDGDITFLSTPAEEVIEGDFKQELKAQGKIEFMSGKQEFIRLGMLDDVDIAVCQHPASAHSENYFGCGQCFNGIINKKVEFFGKSAHAALSPEAGINALQAAVNAINNINSLREAFPEKDYVRVHYIITNGGVSSNIIPDYVSMQMGVRAANIQKMSEVNEKINNAIKLGASVVGAYTQISDYSTYLPFVQSRELTKLFLKNAAEFTENTQDLFSIHRSSSTDAGDFSSILPTIHPIYGGVHSIVHSDDCYIENEDLAYVQSVKPIAGTIIDLLYDGAKKAISIKQNYKAIFNNKEEYINFFK